MWMDLENIMLSEISQRVKDKYSMISHVESKKYYKQKQMYIAKEKQTCRYIKQTSGYQWGEARGEGQVRGIGLRDTNYYV